MRYRRSVKICKGVKLNFSKSGPSVTVGGRGCSVNFGKKGTYLNTSIPGTGFYDRKKIGGGSSAKSSRKSTSAPVLRPFSVEYDQDNNIVVRDDLGARIVDPSELRRIRGTYEYKERVKRLSEERLREFEAYIGSYVDIYKSCPEVLSIADYRAGFSGLRKEIYKAEEFSEACPTKEGVREQLRILAKYEVKTFKFWEKSKLIDEYVEANYQEALEKSLSQWHSKKEAFDSQELEKTRASEEEYREKVNELNRLINNDESYVSNSIERWLNSVEFPFEFNLNYEIQGSLILIDLDLPEIEDMPMKYARQMANGTVKIKDRTKKDQKLDYYHCVLGLGLFFATNLMCCAIGMEDIIISAYTQRANNKGLINDDYIYSVRFDREGLSKIDLKKNVDTIFFSFDHICEIRADKSFKTINPY